MADLMAELGVWVAAAYMLMIYSYPFKDTPLFKFAEHTMLGLGVAITTVMGIRNILDIAVGGLVTKGAASSYSPDSSGRSHG